MATYKSGQFSQLFDVLSQLPEQYQEALSAEIFQKLQIQDMEVQYDAEKSVTENLINHINTK